MENFNLRKYLAENRLLKEELTYQFSEYDFDITKEPGYQEEIIKKIKSIYPNIENDIMMRMIRDSEDYYYSEAREENKLGRDYEPVGSDEFADSIIMSYRDQYLEENKLWKLNMNTLLENRIEGLIREKLCKKGEAYRKRRMAAGEKSSAYLSGRAVKVCKGQMSGKKKKKTNEIEDRISESLRDWFKKEDWVRIDTQGNISGKCGTMKNKKNPSRCLPRKKAQGLTKAERKSSAQKKKREGKKGKQFVKNPK